MAVAIKKAVFPIAGLGTRLFPLTKTIPKVMLPVVDKPLIQHAVEEAVSAGITQLIFVVNKNDGYTRSVKEYFSSNFEVKASLEKIKGDEFFCLKNKTLPENISCTYVEQKMQLFGFGHAILCTEKVVGEEPFAVLLADDFIITKNKTCLQQIIDIYKKTRRSVLAIQPMSYLPKEIEKCAFVKLRNSILREKSYSKIINVKEKSKPDNCASHYTYIGRYVLTHEIFKFLRMAEEKKKDEFIEYNNQFNDSLRTLLSEQNIYGYNFSGKRYDCGCGKLNYLKANIEYAMQHKDIGKEIVEYLQEIVSNTGEYDSRKLEKVQCYKER